MGRPGYILVLSVLSIVLGDDLSRCPSSLIRNQYLRTFRDHCYEFVIYRETYWDLAQSECAHKGGHFVTVRDMATQQFLMQTLTSLNFKKHGIWIGMDDRNSESHFVWVSGEVTHFSYWAPGEPSVLHRLEDCVLMKSSKSYLWEDHACHLWPQHYTYICEYGLGDDCPPGSYPDPSKGECTLCPVGTYKEYENNKPCVPCSPGLHTASKGSANSSSCKGICQPGSSSPDGLVPCSPCPIGKYQGMPGSKICTSCPQGQTTQTDGAMEIQDCI